MNNFYQTILAFVLFGCFVCFMENYYPDPPEGYVVEIDDSDYDDKKPPISGLFQ